MRSRIVSQFDSHVSSRCRRSRVAAATEEMRHRRTPILGGPAHARAPTYTSATGRSGLAAMGNRIIVADICAVFADWRLSTQVSRGAAVLSIMDADAHAQWAPTGSRTYTQRRQDAAVGASRTSWSSLTGQPSKVRAGAQPRAASAIGLGGQITAP
jgi:hypothetical protein